MPDEAPPHADVQQVAIAVDAMGGDHAPEEIVAGAVAAATERGIPVVWPALLASCAPSCLLTSPLRSSGSPPPRTPSAWTKGPGQFGAAFAPASPSPASWSAEARRGQSSRAGSTGAIVATARLRLRSVPGLIREAITVVLPTRPDPTFLVDAGAIADPKPEMLLQFAQLGVAYAQIAHGIDEPRVGLLAMGAEPGKGNRLARRAHELLAAPPPHGALPIRFAGNIEGSDLLAGQVDVIVTDGFTGNVALKTLEGAALRRRSAAAVI